VDRAEDEDFLVGLYGHTKDRVFEVIYAEQRITRAAAERRIQRSRRGWYDAVFERLEGESGSMWFSRRPSIFGEKAGEPGSDGHSNPPGAMAGSLASGSEIRAG
jgi:hypothetical protein